LFFIHHNFIDFPNLTLYETPIVEVANTLLIKSPFKVLFDFSFSKASKIALYFFINCSSLKNYNAIIDAIEKEK